MQVRKIATNGSHQQIRPTGMAIEVATAERRRVHGVTSSAGITSAPMSAEAGLVWDQQEGTQPWQSSDQMRLPASRLQTASS